MKKSIIGCVLVVMFGFVACKSGSGGDPKELVVKTWVVEEQKGEGLEKLKSEIPADQQKAFQKQLDEMKEQSYLTINADNTFEMNNGLVVTKGKWELNDREMKLIRDNGKTETLKLNEISDDNMELESNDETLGQMIMVYKPKK